MYFCPENHSKESFMRLFKIFRILVIILIVLAAIVSGLGLFARNDYHFERSITIDAPRDTVYQFVRYFENMKAWSPWADIDPEMQDSIFGKDGQVGTVYKWKSEKGAGEGWQRITVMNPDRIEMEVKIFKPWESTAPAFMTFEEQDSLTKVSWGYDMYIGFPWNGLAMFTNVEGGLGRDYEHGLENLKKICERMAHPTYNGYEVVLEESVEKHFAGVRGLIPFSELSTYYQDTLPAVFQQLQADNILIAGQPAGLYWNWDDSTQTTDMAAVIPVAADAKPAEGIELFTLPAGQIAKVDFFGSYDSISQAHLALDTFMLQNNLEQIPPGIEQYISDPATEPDSTKWLTRVMYYVREKGD